MRLETYFQAIGKAIENIQAHNKFASKTSIFWRILTTFYPIAYLDRKTQWFKGRFHYLVQSIVIIITAHFEAVPLLYLTTVFSLIDLHEKFHDIERQAIIYTKYWFCFPTHIFPRHPGRPSIIFDYPQAFIIPWLVIPLR